MRHIVVDGYNVIRRDPALSRLLAGTGGLERAREGLLIRLAGSARLQRDELTVVFDAANVPGRSSDSIERRSPRLRVVYSASGQIADEVIKRIAADLLADGNRQLGLVVVTADNEIRQAVAEAASYYDLDARLSNLAPQEQQRSSHRHSVAANLRSQGKGGVKDKDEPDEAPAQRGTRKRGPSRRASKSDRKRGPGDLRW